LFIDLGALDEGIEDVENRIAAPCIWIFSEEVCFFFLWGGAGNAVTVTAEGFELVDEFVYYVPSPVILINIR